MIGLREQLPETENPVIGKVADQNSFHVLLTKKDSVIQEGSRDRRTDVKDYLSSSNADGFLKESKPPIKKALQTASIISKSRTALTKIDEQPNVYNMVFNDNSPKVGSDIMILKDYNQKDFPFELREEPKLKAFKDVIQTLNSSRTSRRQKEARIDEKVGQPNMLQAKNDVNTSTYLMSLQKKRVKKPGNRDSTDEQSVETVERGINKHLDMVVKS